MDCVQSSWLIMSFMLLSLYFAVNIRYGSNPNTTFEGEWYDMPIHLCLGMLSSVIAIASIIILIYLLKYISIGLAWLLCVIGWCKC